MPCRSRIRVLGSGAAALAAGLGLARLGMDVVLCGHPPVSGPTLLLNATTVRLLDELFGCAAALLGHGWLTRGRLVSWSRRGEPDEVDDQGLIIGAGKLHRILLDALQSGEGKSTISIVDSQACVFDRDAGWTLDARGRGAGGTGELVTIGERVAICKAASLTGDADRSLTAVEAVGCGWIILLPLGAGQAAVQAVVPRSPQDADQTLCALLADSRVIRRFVAELHGESQVLPCAPRFRSEPTRSAWIAAGDAALSFDPLCGDGTGQALRCGLLAAAVLGAISQGEPESDCLAHYRYRLRRAMLAHLRATIGYYRNVPHREIWQNEIEVANRLFHNLARGPIDVDKTRYRLQGFSLLRI
jgi:2-polyprenyl-6-methoxyphenol hydroxylase-like FAD-dependent oxidoreductase